MELILAFCLGYVADHNYAPTRREIADHLETKMGYRLSTERVRQLLVKLQTAGRVTIDHGVHRGLKIVEKKP